MLKGYNKKILYGGLIIVIAILVFVVGITYAFFTAGVGGNDLATPTTITAGTLELTLNDTNLLDMSNALPGAHREKTFTVKNNGAPTQYNIIIDNVSTTFVGGDLVYTVTSNNNGGMKSETVLPNTEETIIENVTIEAGVTQTYTLGITFKETGSNQNNLQGATYSGRIQIVPVNGTVNLIGRATNGITSLPFETMMLESEPRTTTTDANGYYEFKEVELGTHTVSIIRNEEKVASKQILIELGAETLKVNDRTLKTRDIPTKSINFELEEVNSENILNMVVENPTVLLTELSGFVYVGKNKKIDIHGTHGELSCESSSNSIATCLIENNQLIIRPVSNGIGTITVRDIASNETIIYSYEVKTSTLLLSEYSGIVKKYLEKDITISGDNIGKLYCGTKTGTTDCKISGNTLKITGKNEGTDIITVREANGDKIVNYNVNVIANTAILTAHDEFGTIASTANWSGSGAMATKTVNYNSVIGPLPSVNDRIGYKFEGWYNDITYTTELAENTPLNQTTATFQNLELPQSTANIYSKWNPDTFSFSMGGAQSDSFESVTTSYNSSDILDGYVVVGDTNLNGWIVKTELNGELIWSHTADDSSSFNGVILSRNSSNIPDGYVVISKNSSATEYCTAEGSAVIKYSLTGERLWTYCNSDELLSDIVLSYNSSNVPDGYVIAGGRNDVVMFKVDFSGNEIWSKIIGSDTGEVMEGVTLSRDVNGVPDGYVAAGRTIGNETNGNWTIVGDDYNGLLIKFGLNGTFQWATTTPPDVSSRLHGVELSYNSSNVPDGFVATGRLSRIIKFSLNGVREFNETYAGMDECVGYSEAKDIILSRNSSGTPDGYVIVGSSLMSCDTSLYDVHRYDAIIVKLDFDGSVDWLRPIGAYGYNMPADEFQKVVLSHNSNNVLDGYIAVGYTKSSLYDYWEYNGGYDAIMLKFNKDSITGNY